MNEKDIEKVEKVKNLLLPKQLEKPMYENILLALYSLQKDYPVHMIIRDNLDANCIITLAQIKDVYKDQLKLFYYTNKHHYIWHSIRIGKNLFFENKNFEGNYDVAKVIENSDKTAMKQYMMKFNMLIGNCKELKSPQEIYNLGTSLNIKGIKKEEERIQ